MYHVLFVKDALPSQAVQLLVSPETLFFVFDKHVEITNETTGKLKIKHFTGYKKKLLTSYIHKVKINEK